MNTLVMLTASSIAWGAVLCAAAWLLQRNSNLSGRARQWIWRGATALLLAPWIAAPVVSALGLGLGPAETAPLPAMEEPTAELLSAVGAIETSNVQTGVVENGGSLLAWLAGLSWIETAIVLLITGWIVRFVAAQLAVRSLLGIVNHSRLAEPGPASMALAGWTQRLGLRRQPRLRIVEASVSPFSYGVFRPVICLPEGLEERLSPEALDLVIGHECLHVARGDGWMRPLERIAADIFWFNPFAWLIRRQLDVARELACDECVVDLSEARHAYARTLRDVASFSAGLSHAAPAASMSLAGGRSLMLRVTRTLAQAKRKPARAAVVSAVMLGLVGAPIAMAQVMLATPAPPPPPAVPAVPVIEAPEAPAALAALEVPQAPPAPTVSGQNVFVSSDGMVRASFTAKVTSTGGSASNGFSVDLESAARNSAGEACAAQLDGLSELKVTKNQTVNRGEVIGKQGNGGNMSFAVQCSDELDGKGRPALSVSPTPPAPPAPVAPVHQVAPVAPPSPPSPVTAVAPVAPPAPTSWGTVPAPPSPPSPAPAASPGPAPLAAPSPAPHVHPTPATPVVPPTPKTPTAYKPTNQSTPGGIVLIRQENNKATFKLQGETKPVLEQQSAITSPFGYTTNPFSKEVALHTGVDLRGPVGLAIHAPAGAKVAFAGEKGSNGNVVELDLGDGVGMRFAHLDKIDVAEGGRVKAGDAIGTIGVTGLTTGPHVHVEIYKDGKAVDPETVENLTLSAD